MTTPALTDAELLAYLDEALPSETMAEIERWLRCDAAGLARLAEVSARRDAGVHSLSEIWRRHHLSCPSRQEWGSFLLGGLPAAQVEFCRFHLKTAGCRRCQANLADLERQQGREPAAATRRQRYFQSSAGRLSGLS
jgi:anti-sigma factor RsiW